MKILVTILTYSGTNDRGKACKDTWVKTITKPHECYFYGDLKQSQSMENCWCCEPADGEDRYRLGEKTLNMFKKSLEYEWDFLYKCDDDTYLVFPRLVQMLKKYDSKKTLYIGHPVANPFCYAQGGAGYVLTRSAVEMCIQNPKPFVEDEGEDHAVGRSLIEQKIFLRHEYKFNSHTPDIVLVNQQLGIDDIIKHRRTTTHYVQPEAIYKIHARLHSVNVVYHLFCENDGVDRFNKTYNKIVRSGLIDKITSIHVNCVGSYREKISEMIQDYDKVITHQTDNDRNESDTIGIVKNIAKNHPYGNTLYLHSKGASNKFDNDHQRECIDEWVNFMEYHLIENHETCLVKLEQYSTCGCNMSDTNGTTWNIKDCWHYSGNFWWSQNDYLNEIRDCEDDYQWCESVFISDGNNKRAKHYELSCSEYVYPDILNKKIDPEKYKQN